jgi:hypothetical protein
MEVTEPTAVDIPWTEIDIGSPVNQRKTIQKSERGEREREGEKNEEPRSPSPMRWSPLARVQEPSTCEFRGTLKIFVFLCLAAGIWLFSPNLSVWARIGLTAIALVITGATISLIDEKFAKKLSPIIPFGVLAIGCLAVWYPPLQPVFVRGSSTLAKIGGTLLVLLATCFAGVYTARLLEKARLYSS